MVNHLTLHTCIYISDSLKTSDKMSSFLFADDTTVIVLLIITIYWSMIQIGSNI